VAEVLEALHARGDNDEDVGVVARGGGEGVGKARRDDDEVSAFGIHFATAVIVLLSAALLFAV
jgi:hypothetical protein